MFTYLYDAIKVNLGFNIFSVQNNVKNNCAQPRVFALSI